MRAPPARPQVPPKGFRQDAVELPRAHYPRVAGGRFTEHGVIELRQGVGSVGDQLDQTTTLEVCHRVGIADVAQDLPLQHLGGGQDLDHLQLLRSQRLQPELQSVVQFAIRPQRAM